MKKLSLLILAISSIAFKNAPKITVGAYLLMPDEVKSQNVINYSDFLAHKYHLLVTNTVGATTPSNAVSVFCASKDTVYLQLSNIKLSGIASGTALPSSSSSIFFANSDKVLRVATFSLTTFPEIDPMFNTKFSGKSTTDLLEGSNLYYTPSRFNTAFAGKSTADLSEGSNLYYTAARTRTTVSAGTGISYVSGTGVITNSLPDQTVTIAPSNTNITVSGSYPTFTVGNASPDQTVNFIAGNTDVTVSGTYPNFTITPYVATTYSVTRAVNSSTFQVSATRRCSVIYNIGISCTASIGSNASGSLMLQYSLNGGSTWLNGPEVKNSNTVTLAIALNLVNNQQTTTALNNIPAGAIFRMVPTTSGTTVITFISGFETY